ncbi:F0F1 ATP synthase subunit delta [Thermomonospora catenispora]|uniref:F0F1 ATP synthase subunit delta n=1 Tax=Thermomonospora catenispora TaxID=2493090 RepID=UPI00111F8C8C|nr:F0F1 ATP synthase subunit delta [Thermomonospora catenispora]TNY37001.1 F0F1 ATP synthase subunit delta [Thermomonospora catenispora]
MTVDAMLGAVGRASLAAARDSLEAVIPTADLDTLGADLLAVLHLLDREHGLRRAVSDPAAAVGAKVDLVRGLLAGQISEAALTVVADVVRLRWSTPSQLTDALETLAVTAEAARAQAAGVLDDLEDELFRFSRVVEGEPRLRSALTDPALPADRKRALLAELLEGKVTPSTLRLVTEVVTYPRGRSLEGALSLLGKLVAQRRSRLVALVRSAVELSERQRTRLAAVLAAAYGQDVHLNIEIDPSVVGGLSIQIGDEIIDGTIAGRLDDVRRRLAS